MATSRRGWVCSVTYECVNWNNFSVVVANWTCRVWAYDWTVQSWWVLLMLMMLLMRQPRRLVRRMPCVSSLMILLYVLIYLLVDVFTQLTRKIISLHRERIILGIFHNAYPYKLFKRMHSVANNVRKEHINSDAPSYVQSKRALLDGPRLTWLPHIVKYYKYSRQYSYILQLSGAMRSDSNQNRSRRRGFMICNFALNQPLHV